jgi:GxxExxY protein
VEFDETSNKVIGCAIEVHRHLGPGLLESAYRLCLSHELTMAGLKVYSELALPVEYKSVRLDCGYRADLVVGNRDLLLELKSVDQILPLHEAQILTYMKISHIRLGLLINFNVPVLKNGLKRFVL